MEEISLDSAKNPFMDVGNIRITYIAADKRTEVKDWAGSDVLRVQAYRDAKSSSLHRGAEFPVHTPEEFVDLISVLCRVYNHGRSSL